MDRVWGRRETVATAAGDHRTAALRLDDVAACEPRILEGTAASIWGLLDGVRTVDAVVAELVGEYGASPDAVRADVVHFIDALASEGFLESVDSASASPEGAA